MARRRVARMSEPVQVDFGATLRAARERKGASLRQIANTTKISVSTLEALEANDFERLPGGIFTRSFVRSYALEIGLDPEAAVRDFLAQASAERMLVGSVYDDDSDDRRQYLSQQRIASTALWIGGLSVPIVALLLFLGWQSAPEEQTSPRSAVPDRAADQGPEPDVGTDRAPGVVPTAPPAVARGVAVGPLTIEIHPRGLCWVSLIVDGEPAFSRVMEPGEREFWEAERQIVINVGNAGSFDYSINRQPGRALGEPGEVVTARINRENYRSFVSP